MLTMPKERTPSVNLEFNQPLIRSDRREHERIVSHAPLIIAPFGIRHYREYRSMTFNHNKNGMCFETAAPFKPGCILCIRLSSSQDDQMYHGDRKFLRTFTLAEVRWCREYRDDFSFSTYYRIGIRYC